jgi:hypothetical protein
VRKPALKKLLDRFHNLRGATHLDNIGDCRPLFNSLQPYSLRGNFQLARVRGELTAPRKLAVPLCIPISIRELVLSVKMRAAHRIPASCDALLLEDVPIFHKHEDRKQLIILDMSGSL